MNYDEASQSYSVVGLSKSGYKNDCGGEDNLRHLTYVSLFSIMDWIKGPIGQCNCPYCILHKGTLSCTKMALVNFPEDLFAKCPHIHQDASDVKIIQMNNQNITRLSLDSFQYFPNVKTLDFSGNKINRLTYSKVNRVLPHLRKLYLKRNDIAFIPEGSLDRFVKLEEADFAFNYVSEYTTHSWTFMHDKRNQLVLSNVTVLHDLKRDSSYTQQNERDYCTDLRKKRKILEPEKVCKRNQTTLDCSNLNSLSDVNSIVCYDNSKTYQSILITFPLDDANLKPEDLGICEKFEFFQGLYSKGGGRFDQKKEYLTLRGINFDLSTLEKHTSEVTKEVTVRAAVVYLSKELVINYDLKIRAKQVIISKPLKMNISIDTFQEKQSNHVQFERHIQLSKTLLLRHRRFGRIDVVDSVPAASSNQVFHPRVLQPTQIEIVRDWYDLTVLNLIYLCARKIVMIDVDHASTLAAWYKDFHSHERIIGSRRIFTEAQKFADIKRIAQHENVHYVPQISIESLDTMLSSQESQVKASIKETHKYDSDLDRAKTTIVNLKSNMKIVLEQHDLYRKGEEALHSLIFKQDNISWNLALQHRKNSTSSIVGNLEVIDGQLSLFSQIHLEAVLYEAQNIHAHYDGQVKNYEKTLDAKMERTMSSKKTIITLFERLQNDELNLKDAVEEAKNQMIFDSIIQGVTALIDFGLAMASLATGDPMGALDAVKIGAHLIKFMIEIQYCRNADSTSINVASRK